MLSACTKSCASSGLQGQVVVIVVVVVVVHHRRRSSSSPPTNAAMIQEGPAEAGSREKRSAQVCQRNETAHKQ
jgi:hypothetical protein